MADADRRLRVSAQEARRAQEGDDAILRAFNSKTCGLPPDATFAPTDGHPVQLRLSKGGSSTWFHSWHGRSVVYDSSGTSVVAYHNARPTDDPRRPARGRASGAE